jgi:hypothetical protein
MIDLIEVLPDPDLPMSNTFFFIDISHFLMSANARDDHSTSKEVTTS